MPFTIGSSEVVSQVTPTDLVITPDALAAIGPSANIVRFGRLTGEASPRAGSIFFAAPTDVINAIAVRAIAVRAIGVRSFLRVRLRYAEGLRPPHWRNGQP